MDDRRTQDALDALADLFLTDPDPFEPLNHPRGGDEEPAPAKLEPAPRRGDPRAARFAGPTSSTEARRGAAPAIDAPAVPRSQTAPLIRAWLGNLPGYAAPWLTQFAARRARRGGMTLLLRLEGRALTASLVGVHRSQLASASPSRSRPTLADYDRIAGDLRAEEPGRLLDAAAREPLIRRVMLHHTTPSAGEGDPLATPDHAPASPVVPTSEASIALITGLDDAALGRLGQLLERLPDPADVGASQGSQVELIVAGATAHDAVEALSRLPDDDPAASVDLAETLPRMEPVEQRAVGDWTLADADLERLLERIDALPAWTESRDPSQPIDATDSPEPSIESLGPAIAADRDFAGPGDETLEQKPRDKPSGPLEPPIAREPEDRPEDAPVGEQLDAGELGHAVDDHGRPGGRAGSEGSASVAASAAAASADGDGRPDGPPRLSSFLTAATGGVALEARCPDHPEVQLLLDEEGRLHLLASDRSLGASPAHAAERMLVALAGARRWVRRHLDLIAMTQRQCRFDAQRAPIVHLFVSDGRVGTQLVARLGRAVRIHLLREVRLSPRDVTWVESPLN